MYFLILKTILNDLFFVLLYTCHLTFYAVVIKCHILLVIQFVSNTAYRHVKKSNKYTTLLNVTAFYKQKILVTVYYTIKAHQCIVCNLARLRPRANRL